MERYIQEYASSKLADVKKNRLMREFCKDEAIGKIEKALSMRERGLITVDEAIKMILEA